MPERRIVLNSEPAWQLAKRIFVGLRDVKEPHEVVFRPHKSRRSVEQNALLWALLHDISEQVKDEDGKLYAPETWHSFFKAKFIGKDTILIDGDPVLVERSTTKLTVMEFCDYVTQIQAWSVDHGVRFYETLQRTGS